MLIFRLIILNLGHYKQVFRKRITFIKLSIAAICLFSLCLKISCLFKEM